MPTSTTRTARATTAAHSSFALKINLPGHWGAHVAMAAAYGQLGERDAAGRALRDLLKLRPDFAADGPERTREVVGAGVRGVA